MKSSIKKGAGNDLWLVYHFNYYLFLLYYHTHVYKRIDALSKSNIFLDSVAYDSLVFSHVSGLSALFNKAQKKPDEIKILHLLLHGGLTRYLYSMCWYNDDDTTKYCQHTIGCYVSSFHLLLDSNGSP